MKPAHLAYLPDQFWNDGVYDGCMRITRRYRLDPLDQHGGMHAAVHDLLIGCVTPGEFVTHLRERINSQQRDKFPIISEATAEHIANDIKKEMLAPMREILLSANPGWQTWLLR